MNDNKALWQRVCMTDPKAVKPITGKQYQGNSPKPYWIVERLTEEFGPCGIGWGFSVLNERFERFSDTDTLHVALVDFWYVLGDKTGHLQQVGQTKASYMTGAGKFMLDEDAPKKSVTDALVKCASYIGFAGDIFSGRWDDSKYVAEARKHYSEADEPAKPAAAPLPHTPSVANQVMNDSEAIEPEHRQYLDELADTIKTMFPKSGPKRCAEHIALNKVVEDTHLIYLSLQLPTPMRNAIKRESQLLNQQKETA